MGVGGPGSGSFPGTPDHGPPFVLTARWERESQRLGRLQPSDFLFSLLFPVSAFLVDLLIKGSFICLYSRWSLPHSPRAQQGGTLKE